MQIKSAIMRSIKRYLYFFLPFLALNIGFAATANADIYMRVGKNGTIYFSNVPVSGSYKVFMRTKPDSAAYGGNSGAYSVAYGKIIFNAAKKYNVSPVLIEAVIKAESGYNAKAVSDKGAEGLMQLMPETQDVVGVSNPFNPSQNINGGTKYLKSLITRYNGNLPLAVAAYNAGSKAVDRFGGIPPYDETKNYVEEVMHYYRKNKSDAK